MRRFHQNQTRCLETKESIMITPSSLARKKFDRVEACHGFSQVIINRAVDTSDRQGKKRERGGQRRERGHVEMMQRFLNLYPQPIHESTTLLFWSIWSTRLHTATSTLPCSPVQTTNLLLVYYLLFSYHKSHTPSMHAWGGAVCSSCKISNTCRLLSS